MGDFVANVGKPLRSTVAFNAGETSKIVTVNVAGDSAAEADEGFTVTLSNPNSGTTIAAATAQGAIVNDDGSLLPGLSSCEIPEAV